VRKFARVTPRRAAPSRPDAIQHGPTHTLPQTRRCRTPTRNTANPGTVLTPAGACQRAWLCSHDPGPLTITLTITMPDAWSTPQPLCQQAPIRSAARVIFKRQCARREGSISARLLEASRRRRANLPSGFCSCVRRACNSIAGEAVSTRPLRRFILAIVIACEKNLSRGGLARLLIYPHVN